MGGVIAASFVAQQIRPMDGLVLSSPGFLPQLKAFDKLLLNVMKRLAPHICVDNGLNPHWVARDPQAVLRYKQDPLVHRQISAALAQWIIDTGNACIATATLSHTPTLLLYAGQDHIVRAEGSMAYAESMPSSCLTAHCYPEMYHEIFNDPAVADVFADLQSWLAQFNA
jgi:alpha-beta hydrolase superfamily lysophospholipase